MKKKIVLRSKVKTKQISPYLNQESGWGFRKGNPGRPRGAMNRENRPFVSLKQSFLDAFNDPRIGGTAGIVEWVTSARTPLQIWKRKKIFYSWIVRMLPRSLDVERGSPMDELLEKWKHATNEDILARAKQIANDVSGIDRTGNGAQEATTP